MEITKTEQIQVKFTIIDGSTKFTSALYMTQAEKEATSNTELEAKITQAYDSWKTAIIAPTPPLTEEQENAQLEFMIIEKERLTNEILKIDPSKVANAYIKLNMTDTTSNTVKDGSGGGSK